MARLNYDSERVDSALALLAKGKAQLTSTDSNISAAISKITSARGIEYVDTSGVVSAAGMAQQCQGLIDQTVTGINRRVAAIMDYNADVDGIGVGTRFLSTIGLGVTKFTEGIFTAGEKIVDGFASGLGLLAGIFGGEEGRKWRDTSLSEFIKKDHVGDAYKDLYKNELSEMVKASYMQENGFGANLCKLIGISTGYSLALSGIGALGGSVGAITSGASSSSAIFAGAKLGARAALSSLKGTMALAATGGVGLGTEAGLQSGLKYNESLLNGAKYGAIQAGAVLLFHGIIKLGRWGINKAKMKWNWGKGGTSSTGNAGGPSGPDGTNPTGSGSGTGPTGSGSGTSQGSSGSMFGKISEEGMKHYGDSLDDLIEAANSGKISYNDALKIVRENFVKATDKASKIKWHPDKVQGALRPLEEAIQKAGGNLDVPFNLKAGGATVSGGGGTPPAGSAPTSGGGTSLAGSMPARAIDSVDDLIEAANTGKISYNDAMRIVRQNFENATDKAGKLAWNMDKTQGALRPLEEAIQKAGGNLDVPFNLKTASGGMPTVGDTPARAIGDTVDDLIGASGGGGKPPVGSTPPTEVAAVGDTSAALGKAPMNPASTGSTLALPSGETPRLTVDDLLNPTVNTGSTALKVIEPGAGTGVLGSGTATTAENAALALLEEAPKSGATLVATKQEIPAITGKIEIETSTPKSLMVTEPASSTLATQAAGTPTVTQPPGLPAVTEPGGLPAVTQPPGLPAVTEPGGLPKVITQPGLPAITQPPGTPVIPPGVTTPVIPTGIPPVDGTPVIPGVTSPSGDGTPIISGDPSSSGTPVAPGGPSGGGTPSTPPGETPIVPTIPPTTVPPTIVPPTTEIPTTMPPTTPENPFPEYVPIPQTGIEKDHVSDYIPAVAIGAGLGAITGVASIVNDRRKEKEEENNKED